MTRLGVDEAKCRAVLDGLRLDVVELIVAGIKVGVGLEAR